MAAVSKRALKRYRWPRCMSSSSWLEISVSEPRHAKNLHSQSRRRWSILHSCVDYSRALPLRTNPGIRVRQKRLRRLTSTSSHCLFVFHHIESHVRRVDQRFDGIGILRITGNSHANGKRWFFGVFRKEIANSSCYQCRGGYAGLRQNQSKLVSALPRCGVYAPAAICQYVPQPADRPVSC